MRKVPCYTQRAQSMRLAPVTPDKIMFLQIPHPPGHLELAGPCCIGPEVWREQRLTGCLRKELKSPHFFLSSMQILPTLYPLHRHCTQSVKVDTLQSLVYHNYNKIPETTIL